MSDNKKEIIEETFFFCLFANSLVCFCYELFPFLWVTDRQNTGLHEVDYNSEETEKDSGEIRQHSVLLCRRCFKMPMT